MSAFIKAAVIGHPILHSKSPLIHSYWIKKYGLSGSYEAIDIAPEELGVGFARLFEDGFSGFNVTVPHKEAVIGLCDVLDDAARAIGAVNTVYKKEGQICGGNTDGFGFIQNIKEAALDFDFSNGPAVILGAGGAARAIVHALVQEDVEEIRLINRTQERAEALFEDMGAQGGAIEWEAREGALRGANLLVNTTSLGMDGQAALDLALDDLPENALVNDIVYQPLETPLLAEARGRGNKTVSGIGMLLHQARPAFEKWFGVMPDVDEALRELVLK